MSGPRPYSEDYPFGNRKWMIYNNPCYNEKELLVTLNLNACNETEFNCADGQCIHINERCNGKLNCADNTGDYKYSLSNYILTFH